MVRIRDRLTALEKRMYRRNILIPGVGEAGQLKLLQSRLLLVGLGGLGSSALYYLAACGIGEIGIVDGDRVDLSNLQRQILHGIQDVGKEKTLSAKESIARIREDVQLNVYPSRLTPSNAEGIISSYDFVVEATDNFESKFLVNDTCVRLGKAFSHAGIVGTYGQVMTVVPGEGPCFRCVFDEAPAPGTVDDPDEVGVFGSVPGVIGAIQATEAMKYLLHSGRLLVGRLLTWDAFDMSFREVALPMGKRCRACGGNESPRVL